MQVPKPGEVKRLNALRRAGADLDDQLLNEIRPVNTSSASNIFVFKQPS